MQRPVAEFLKELSAGQLGDLDGRPKLDLVENLDQTRIAHGRAPGTKSLGKRFQACPGNPPHQDVVPDLLEAVEEIFTAAGKLAPRGALALIAHLLHRQHGAQPRQGAHGGNRFRLGFP